jgi:lipopolysaccharide export system protein LptA
VQYRHIRITRVVVVVALIALVAVTSWSYLRRLYRAKADKQVIPSILPSNAENATVGFNYTKIESGRTIYSVKAWRNLGLKDNKNILEDVEVLVFGKNGDRYDRIHSARADYDQDAGTVTFKGDVTLLLSSKKQEMNAAAPSDGTQKAALTQRTQVTSSMVTYSQRSNRVDTPAPVQFVFNEVSGNAVGMHYDAAQERLLLEGNVHVVVDRKSGAPPVEIMGSSMTYSKALRQIVFTAPAELWRGTDRLDAQEMTLHLDENNHAHDAVARGSPLLKASTNNMQFDLTGDQMTAYLDSSGKLLSSIVAEGHVRGNGRSETSTTEITAGRLTATFEGKRNELHDVVSEDDVMVKMSPTAGISGNGAAAKNPALTQNSLAQSADVKILRSARVEISMRPGGREMERLVTPVPAVMELIPAVATQDRRVIKGDRFDATFAGPKNTLESFHATQHVSVDLEPPSPLPTSTHRRTTSDSLTAAFNSPNGELQTIEQSGYFHFYETALPGAKSVRPGDTLREASSHRAHYSAATRVTTLDGSPQVWDASGRTSATQMVLDEASDEVTATGNVMTVYQSKSSASATPFSNSNSPVLVSADKLVGHTRAKTAVYSGNVRMWQDDDVVKADEVQLDQNARTLLAQHHVVSSFLNQQSGAPKKDFVTITAETLHYSDSQHLARYDRNVVMRGDMGTVRAPTLEIYLAQDPNPQESRIDRATAQGGVTITQPERRATAERADFVSREDKIVLTGNQPTIIDNTKGATTGRELTFYTRDDRILVDGDSQARATSQHKVTRQ